MCTQQSAAGDHYCWLVTCEMAQKHVLYTKLNEIIAQHELTLQLCNI